MPKITSIQPQKNKKGVNVFLDGKFSFGLNLETYVKSKIKTGDWLSNGDIEKLDNDSKLQRASEVIFRFATLRPRSEKEFRDWLTRKKIPLKFHKGLQKKLKNLKLLDDKKFALWWVGQRIQFSAKSKKELALELKIKGISKEIIEDTLEEKSIDDSVMAKKLIEKKKYMWERFDKTTAKRKKMQFLARKGFGWEVIKNILKDEEKS
jgi:regulatory protein